jgi:alpha-galactosidase
MSLWSLAASPLILGTDLTNLDPADLKYLTNRAVLSAARAYGLNNLWRTI